MAAELKLVEPSHKVTLIHSRERLLSSEPLPNDFKDRSYEVLREAGVEVILNDRVTDMTPVDSKDCSPLFRLTLKDGSYMLAGHVIWAISKSVPSTSFMPENVLDPEGYVKIGPTYFLRSTSSINAG